MPRSKVTSDGLKVDLTVKKGYKPPSSIAEYIWNGFDAGATLIQIKGDYRPVLGGLVSFSVSDNGSGIPDCNVFDVLYESRKRKHAAPRKNSKTHGVNNLGRLTFFTFASHATWHTVFKGEDGIHYKYSIKIDANSLVDWIPSEPEKTEEPTGTTVVFEGLRETFKDITDPEIISFLKKDFSWNLELYAHIGRQITINDALLDYNDEILKRDVLKSKIIDGHTFKVKFILWREKQNKEFSRYYLLDSNGEEKYTETTTLNNKGDSFFHSIYVQGSFFDNGIDPIIYDKEHTNQGNVFADTDEFKTYSKIREFIEKYLLDKRKPFINEASSALVDEFEAKGVFPAYEKDNPEIREFRQTLIHDAVKQLYRVEPKIFKSLNVEQRKIFVRFLDIILSSGQKDKLFEILREVIDLDSSELDQLAKTLLSSRLSNVIKTIQLLEDRYKAVDCLKMLVLNKKDLKANERDHIQKIVENHYWLFGEEHSLVAAEEADFEAALRSYVHLLRDDDEYDDQKDLTVDHIDKRKQMDIFLCSKSKKNKNQISHIVVELKHPMISLGEKQLSQVKRYMRVIKSQDIFNSASSTWDFYLVGNRFDKAGYMEGELANKGADNANNSLVYSNEKLNYKIYVKQWSDIFDEFDIKHSFLQEKLCLERSKLIEQDKKELATADNIVNYATKLTSAKPSPSASTKKQSKSKSKKAKKKKVVRE